MKKFDWEAFKRGEIEVHFHNEDERNDFIKKIYELTENLTSNLFPGLTEKSFERFCNVREYYVYCKPYSYICNCFSFYTPCVARMEVYWSDYMSKEFTKADLKPFMLAVTRNGEKHIVTDEALVDENKKFIYLYDISDTLENEGGSDCYDIMEVYPKPKRVGRVLSFDLSDRGEPIYIRKETKKMTLKEVCDKLGYDVEIIKDKE